MYMTSVPAYVAFAVVAQLLAVEAVQAQTIDELRNEVEKLGSFEYEDLMSDNVQSIEFSAECTLHMRIRVNWDDGGAWTTDYHIPLQDIRLDGMLIRQNSLEEPPGLFLETRGERIDVHEEQEGVTRQFKEYQVFIRTEDDDKAVLLTAYLRRIIASCGKK